MHRIHHASGSVTSIGNMTILVSENSLCDIKTSIILRFPVMASAISTLIDDLEDRGHLKGIDVANIADVSTATVSRWRTGKATPQPRTQLLIADLRYVVDRLADIYTPDETRIWLYSRNALLDGERAIDLIHEDRTEEVLAVIERLDAGAYL